MSEKSDFIGCYMGKPIHEMSRERLMEIIVYLGEENRRLAERAANYQKHVDWRSFNEDDSMT